MSFVKVTRECGRWNELQSQWRDQCNEYGEDFGDYSPASMPEIKPELGEDMRESIGTYALLESDRYIAAVRLNCVRLPGYTGKVLRARHIVPCPDFDFKDDFEIDDYVNLLTDVFSGVLSVSDKQMIAPHVKFHFRSPAERAFFSEFQHALNGQGIAKKIAMRGSWLYISK